MAVVDRISMIGGVSLHRGTIPSKTLREVIIYLSGIRQRSFYGDDYAVKENISTNDLALRVQQVEMREMAVIYDQLYRNGIHLFYGLARFVDQHTVEIENQDGKQLLKGDHFLIACGTRPADHAEIPFDGESILNADQILDLPRLPNEMIIVGAGVIGLEYGSMFSAMGVKVTFIDRGNRVLPFIDHEIMELLLEHLEKRGASFYLSQTVQKVEKQGDKVKVVLHNGLELYADTLLHAIGRQANSDTLNLSVLDIETDDNGRIVVNDDFRTAVPHIYAAGDVVGFPALAATSMEQGRLAACRMFGAPARYQPGLLPYGIYAIPEISMIGKTEQELQAENIPYEYGKSKYVELARGGIMGVDTGMLKLLFHPETHQVLGVHIIGEAATELIHIGQTVMAFGGTVEYFRDTVFNYPTLAEAYKVAALDGLNRLNGV
ncbi:MAG: Si-specific NAD(P)(+) transhydrogenase [Prolixibacteraceae bacterium]|nr:Si-specific NAD(P)(+) transhydrogenase [Prolixibacteraceae bacterium]